MTEASAPTPSDSIPRAVLVTGAARRIGRALARDLACRGWAVAVHYRSSQDMAEALAAEIAEAGGRAVVLGADLAVERETQALVGRAAEALGPLGCVINNASVFTRDEAADATRASWDAHLEPNLRAPLVLTQAFAAQLPEKAEGLVVNLLDQRVWNLTPHFLSYTVSKSALWTLTRTLALALAPRIRVNGIGPGPTLPSLRQSDAQFARQAAGLPLGKAADPAEICLAVQFLLAAGSVTGQMIAMDGGQHLGWAQARTAPEE